MPQRPEQVLVIRINCVAELVNTDKAIDFLKNQYPGDAIITVSSSNSEALQMLRSDSRLDELRILSASGGNILSRVVALFRTLISLWTVRRTVICCGATDGLTYSKHLLFGLFFGGDKYILGPDLKLVRVFSNAGILSVGRAVKSLIAEPLANKLLLIRYPLRKSRKARSSLVVASDRALIVRLDSLGDVIATLPVIDAVSREIGCPVDILVRREFAPLLSIVPFVRNVHTYGYVDLRPQDPQTHALIENLRSVKYDVVIELTGNSPTARMLCRLSGCPSIVGLVVENARTWQSGIQFLNRQLPADVGSGGYTERARSTAGELGLTVDLVPFLFPILPESRRSAAESVAAAGVRGRYAVLHMKASTEYKSWRIESFVEVADYLIARYDLDVALSGSPADVVYNDRLRELSRFSKRIYNLAGKVSIQVLPALYEGAELVVTVDTGPAHVAGATSVPLIILGFVENAPYRRDAPVTVLDRDEGSDNSLHPLFTITVAQVIDAVDVLLSNLETVSQ